MTSVTLSLAKAHMNIDDTTDDELIAFYIEAADAWLGNFIGKQLAEFDPVPADLKRAVLLLTAYYYEQREAIAAGISMQFAPLGVTNIANAYRERWFGDGE
jgi:uncharacterized phage protein (predicted DNA packaging)